MTTEGGSGRVSGSHGGPAAPEGGLPGMAGDRPGSEGDAPDAQRAWFAAAVDGLLPDLYGTAMRLCGDATEAEDLVALSVAKAWEALPSLQERGAFRGWIFRILNNAFVSECRSARARARHESLDVDDEAESFSLFERLHQPILLWWGNPELEFLNRILKEDLETAIDGLPEEFRSVVVLVDVQGLAYREVADLLDVPVGTVRSRLARGRSRLQEALWEHAVEAGLRDESRPPGSRRPNAGDDEDDR
jgi:RNA polymerase sigma-70 factor, ECF subfamily